jgi:hypothetical protein
MTKTEEFNKAVQLYHSSFYKYTYVISTCIILLQLVSLYRVPWKMTTSMLKLLFCFLIAYILTDFIGGIVHIYADQNSNYNSKFGPLIAVFHLHHKKTRYTPRNIFKVYFYENGYKVWLLVYLIVLVFLQSYYTIPPYLYFILVSIGILSSIAEVSHYLCHNMSSHPIVKQLQHYRILLPQTHHKQHHIHDNINYAFLNGVTDPILNIIAKKYSSGYKNTTDLHYKEYIT